jgi:2-polyprenyl-6-methoxyphenol hydroxylase-like FAD-dependent oxidoreductase
VPERRVGIVGAGIAGLTLALELHDAGIPVDIFEAAPEINELGVGINILPHASKILYELGLEDAMSAIAVLTSNAVFYNRFGQLVFSEPLGKHAGYANPQYSVHRGKLQRVLYDAVRARIGEVNTGYRVVGATQGDEGITLQFADGRPEWRGEVAVACDGIHSVLRKQLHPGEGAPRYSGVNMWRGVTMWDQVLDGASMIRAGWLTTGKMVIYPISPPNGHGKQLINWVAEVETPHYRSRDWNRPGDVEDFIQSFSDWHFDWLDVASLIRSTERVLEFPMVDQDPLPFWTDGRLTLLGDAAHPMVPRGSNGAGQAILDARALRQHLVATSDWAEALVAYEGERLAATANVVLTNRTNPPDAILRVVYERTGDQPFDELSEFISQEELQQISDQYKVVAGYSKASLVS